MDLPQLTATTPAGAGMVAAASRFATEFAAGALDGDRDGTFAVEHLDKLRADGYLIAPIPTQFGGGGVHSIHDILVASSRLAAGDPATAIGVNMHLSIVVGIVRSWRVAAERWDERTVEAIAARLRRIVVDDVVFAAAASEPSPQDLTRPATTATRSVGGWVINGRKVFATMALHASELVVAVSYVDPQRRHRYGFAAVPTWSDGVVFGNDWDALGMRASASGSVSFHDVAIGDAAFAEGFAAGEWSAAMMDRYLVAGAFHAAASLGIAESAHANALVGLRRRAVEDAAADPHIVTTLAANIVDVVAMRSALARAGHLLDEYVARHPMGDPPIADVQTAFAEVQAVKAFLNDAAVRVVDRALALSGGAGYDAGHPLAKAWRDVRAGGFMHPVGANRVATVLANTALGLAPG
jgi:alkylation response protein AidB-like acyl-CoA dehydrogenase